MIPETGDDRGESDGGFDGGRFRRRRRKVASDVRLRRKREDLRSEEEGG